MKVLQTKPTRKVEIRLTETPTMVLSRGSERMKTEGRFPKSQIRFWPQSMSERNRGEPRFAVLDSVDRAVSYSRSEILSPSEPNIRAVWGFN